MTASDDASSLTVPWKRIAISSMLISLTSLTALVVVGAIKNADILSTVALALAVLSFSSQLVIFTVQASTSTQQLRKSEELNLQTTALVAEIRADVGGTKAILTDHFRELLSAAISKSVPEAEKAALAGQPSSSPEQLTRLLADLEESIPRAPASQRDEPREPDRTLSDEDQRIIALMSTWPTKEEAERVLPIYESLSQTEKGTLAISAHDELMSRRKGRATGLRPNPIDVPLIKAGLEELVSSNGKDVVRLTELGRQVGRLAVADGSRPQHLQNIPIWTYQHEKTQLEHFRSSAGDEVRRALQNDDTRAATVVKGQRAFARLPSVSPRAGGHRPSAGRAFSILRACEAVGVPVETPSSLFGRSTFCSFASPAFANHRSPFAGWRVARSAQLCQATKH